MGAINNNVCIITAYKTDKYSCFITDITPDLEVVHHGQVFPFRTKRQK